MIFVKKISDQIAIYTMVLDAINDNTIFSKYLFAM
jgi:hypothetical protein